MKRPVDKRRFDYGAIRDRIDLKTDRPSRSVIQDFFDVTAAYSRAISDNDEIAVERALPNRIIPKT